MNKKVTMTQEAADHLKREGYETAEVGKEYFVLAVGDVGFDNVVIGETPNDYQFPSIPDYMLGLDASQIREEIEKEREEKEINQKREDMKKKRIYISGPISGHDIEERRKAFNEVEVRLRQKGYNTVNPMRNGLSAEATTNEHMRRDIELLMKCDLIYMMKHWSHSAGCMTEFHVARAIGLPVAFEESNQEIKFE